MQIAANTVVTITYELFDATDRVLEKADEPVAYLHGGHSGIFPRVEAALESKTVGDTVSVALEPADGFGEYDAELVRIEPLDRLPPDVAVGGHLVEDRGGQELVWRVLAIAEGKAELDGNHPYAGQRLRLVAKVVEVRKATKEELAHGHVHGPHGHHHH